MKYYKIEIKWGIIFTIASILWMVMEKVLGWHDELIARQTIYTNLFAIVAILIYVLALIDKKKNFFHNSMTWRQGFVSGIIISIVVAILSPLSQYVTYTVISPDYFDSIINYSVENGSMTREQVEGYFNLGSYIIQGFFGALIMGVVTSALVALFIKKRKDADVINTGNS